MRTFIFGAIGGVVLTSAIAITTCFLSEDDSELIEQPMAVDCDTAASEAELATDNEITIDPAPEGLKPLSIVPEAEADMAEKLPSEANAETSEEILEKTNPPKDAAKVIDPADEIKTIEAESTEATTEDTP